MLLLSANLKDSQDQVVSIGPFFSEETVLSQIYLGITDTDGANGNGRLTLEASVCKNQPFFSSDVAAGEPLTGVLDVWVGHVGGTSSVFSSLYIPIHGKNLSGQWIGIRVVMVGSNVSGWIGVH